MSCLQQAQRRDDPKCSGRRGAGCLSSRAPVFQRERSRADRGPAQAPRQRRHPYCRRAAQIPAPARVLPFCPHRPGAGKRPRPRRTTSRMLRARSHGREHRFLYRMTSQGESALSARSPCQCARPLRVPRPAALGGPQGHAPKARFEGMTPAAWLPFSLRLLLNCTATRKAALRGAPDCS